MWRSLPKSPTTFPTSIASLDPIRPQISQYTSSASEWLSKFTNYEQKGVPQSAGTNTDAGFDLGRVHRLLQALGSPHTAQPAIHIAGTKGKGSTAVLLSSILKESGYTVGTYTSPHVVSMNERIAINGRPISNDALHALIASHAPTIDRAHQQEGGALSHFEVLTSLAFKHFADSSVDVAVVETGLGGTRDATNVFPPERVAAAVITPIGRDHMEALGGSLESIVSAKAGIMKEKRPVVIARQGEKGVRDQLLRHARQLDCSPVILIKENDENDKEETHIRLHDGMTPYQTMVGLSLGEGHGDSTPTTSMTTTTRATPIQLRFVGPHQKDNAATAIATAKELSRSQFPKITADTIVKGLESAVPPPGRFQICPLGGNTIAVLDGAHTPESASALVSTLRAVFPTSPVGLVLAMASDKELQGVCTALRALCPHVVVFTEVPVAGKSTRSAAPGSLVAAWQASSLMYKGGRAGGGVRARELIQASIKAAVDRAVSELNSRGRTLHDVANTNEQNRSNDHHEPYNIVVITGSLHTVGAALQAVERS